MKQEKILSYSLFESTLNGIESILEDWRAFNGTSQEDTAVYAENLFDRLDTVLMSLITEDINNE